MRVRDVWFLFIVGLALSVLFGGCSCELTAYKSNQQTGCPCQVEKPTLTAPAGEGGK
jgi:hypothetical protein